MKRSLEKEMMDLPGNPEPVLEEDLANLRKINRYLGACRGILRSLESVVGEGTSFSLLDVGTGNGDLPVAIVRWAKSRGMAARVVALEPHPVIARIAASHSKDYPQISVVRGDGFHLPFRPCSFDFVVASQVLHHFSEQEILRLLKSWSGLARRGILIGDLVRHPLAYCGIWLITRLFTRNEMTRTDGPLSVRRAFTLPEWRELFSWAGIGEFHLISVFPFRLFAYCPLVTSPPQGSLSSRDPHGFGKIRAFWCMRT